MEVAKLLMDNMPEDYVKIVPYQIKKMAIKDCYLAFRTNCKKTKETGVPFTLSFRSRKNPKQSCYIPKDALSISGIYHTIAGKLKISEWGLLNNTYKDLRLVREYGRYYIVVPMELRNTTLLVSENQRTNDVVSLDPGIRTFMTYFSENGYFGKLGNDAFRELMSLHTKLDRLISKRDLEKCKKKKRNLYRHIGKIRVRLHNLVDELHWKVINFLVRNFRVIILPTF